MTPAVPIRDFAVAYGLLAQSLEHARAAVHTRDLPPATAAEHQRLCAVLETCISQAVEADAAAAPVAEHVSTWIGEALARSTERELALIAATDSGGVLGPTAVAHSSWPRSTPYVANDPVRGSDGAKDA